MWRGKFERCRAKVHGGTSAAEGRYGVGGLLGSASSSLHAFSIDIQQKQQQQQQQQQGARPADDEECLINDESQRLIASPSTLSSLEKQNEK